MFLRIFGFLSICATVALLFVRQDPGFGKAALVRDADVILIGTITQVTPVQPQGLFAMTDYKYRGDITTEYPIKGNPVQYFAMYSNAATTANQSTFSPGRALIFLKKDFKGNLVAFRPYICVMPINNNVICWSSDDSLKLVERMQLGAVIGDIKHVAGISQDKKRSLAEYVRGITSPAKAHP